MKTIGVVIPYFGKLPNYFNLFIASCRNNPTIDWLIFSDVHTQIALPDNVHYTTITWNEMKKKFQKIFDFQIKLERPYKLCDFRPSYGEVFAEELKKYDFWAYGDIDLIYGDLRKYLTEEKLSRYDRIYAHGHFSVFRNDEKINSTYKNKCDGCFFYKDVFSSEQSFTFDEWGINEIGAFYQIFAASGYRIYNHVEYADINIVTLRFRCNFGGASEKVKSEMKRKQVYFIYDNGKLTMEWKNRKKINQEVMYIHLQKRKMKVKCNIEEKNYFFVYPNVFTSAKRHYICSLGGVNPYYVNMIIKKIVKSIIEKRIYL